MLPTLSIIVVNYNNKDLIKNCLESIVKNDKRLSFRGDFVFSKEELIPTEIIVVDNGSTDGSLETIRNFQFPKSPAKQDLALRGNSKIKLIENKSNLGFAKANNQGIKSAKGEYLLLLNSDTIVNEGSISQALYWLSGKPEIGAVTCRLVNHDGTIQPTGGSFPNLLNLFTWALFLDDLPLVNKLIFPFHPHPPQFWIKEKWYQKTRRTDWITGAFFMVRKSVVREVGLLPEDYFMYVEEVDWCYRISKAGWKIYYYDGAKIVHLGGGSGNSTIAISGEDRGLKTFFKIHKPKWQLPILKVILLAKNLLRVPLFLATGDPKKANAYWKVIFGN